jgi:hypothetical protein
MLSENQTQVDIVVYEGENKAAKKNHLLGSFTLSGIKPQPKGKPYLVCTFKVDADGILSVTANETTSKISVVNNINVKAKGNVRGGCVVNYCHGIASASAVAGQLCCCWQLCCYRQTAQLCCCAVVPVQHCVMSCNAELHMIMATALRKHPYSSNILKQFM